MSKKLRSKQRMSTINVANENSEKNRSPDIIPGMEGFLLFQFNLHLYFMKTYGPVD